MAGDRYILCRDLDRLRKDVPPGWVAGAAVHTKGGCPLFLPVCRFDSVTVFLERAILGCGQRTPLGYRPRSRAAGAERRRCARRPRGGACRSTAGCAPLPAGQPRRGRAPHGSCTPRIGRRWRRLHPPFSGLLPEVTQRGPNRGTERRGRDCRADSRVTLAASHWSRPAAAKSSFTIRGKTPRCARVSRHRPHYKQRSINRSGRETCRSAVSAGSGDPPEPGSSTNHESHLGVALPAGALIGLDSGSPRGILDPQGVHNPLRPRAIGPMVDVGPQGRNIGGAYGG